LCFSLVVSVWQAEVVLQPGGICVAG